MEYLKHLRQSKGVSQQEVADYLGITRQAYSNYENGYRAPDNETLLKLGEYFDTTVDTILRGKEKAPANAEAYVNDDPELTEYLEELKNRNEMRMLFKLAKNATKADVMRAVAIIEALRKEDND